MEFLKIEEEKAMVRMFSSTMNMSPVDIYVNDNLVFTNLNSIDFSSYEFIDVGNMKFEIYVSGDKSNLLARQMVNLSSKNVYTIAIVDENNTLGMLVVSDKSSKIIEAQNTAFRVVNLCNLDEEIDIYLHKEKLLESISFKQGCDYIDIEPSLYHIKIYNSKDNNELLFLKLNLNSSKIYTIYLVESHHGLQAIQSVDGNSYLQECVVYY